MAKKDRYYNNPNGEMAIEKMIDIKKQDMEDDFIRAFRTIEHSCPPLILRSSEIFCFECVPCWRHAFSQIKEYKNYYKVGKLKFDK